MGFFPLFLLTVSVFDLHTWLHIDNLAALSSVTSEPQISDPFAPEPSPSTAATTDAATASASATTTTITAATAEVDLFGG